MDEEEELENMLIGRNQRRTNRRPEEIQAQNSQAGTSGTGNFTEGILQDVVEESPAIAAAKFVQESPIVKGMQGKIPSAIRRFALPFFSFSKAGGRGILPLAAFGTGYGTGRVIDEASKFLPGMGGEELSTKLARGMAPEVFENENLNSQPAFNAPTLQDLANQRAKGAMTEDDKVDNLQKALQSVPDTPQVVPGTLPTAQEAGQRLIDAAKEFYPGASAPAASTVPTVPETSGLSPDALKAIRSPTIPESVTSAVVPEGLGPMRPVDPRTGAFLSPEVIAAGEGAGIAFPSQVALPEPQQQVPVGTPPMSQAETRARLQQRFGAPTLSQIQALPSDDPRALGLPVDAQGRMMSSGVQPSAGTSSRFEQESLGRQQRIGGTGSFEGDSDARESRIADRDRRPGESQADRDTRIAQGRTQQSASTSGRKYTDSQLRRLFPDKDDYQAARVKDMQGIDPLTNQDYADQDLDRRYSEAQIKEMEGRSEDPPNAIDQFRADAEKIAQEVYGLEPGTDEYNKYVNDYILGKMDAPAYVPETPTYTDAEADAAHAAGKLPIGGEYLLPDGTPQKYAGPKKAEEKKPRTARGRGGQARQDKRNQEDQ